MSYKKIFGVFAMIASSMVLLQFVVEADKIIQYTPNCLCPSKDKFPPPASNGTSKAIAWCGYELGPECDIQRGYRCHIDMANKEAKFATLNCLGGRMYCLPYRNTIHMKYCGSEVACKELLSCKKAMNATVIALEKLRKTYGQNATKFRRPGQ
jgi:hypothetical protein